MDSYNGQKLVPRFDVIPDSTKQAFEFLAEQEWLEDPEWYLAGGTALALWAGHRKSVDLDFFTKKSSFNGNSLLAHFTDNENWRTDIFEENTVYGTLMGAKVSFIAYPFFIPKQSFEKYGTINILCPRDVAVMKIVTISQRGRKRDFFDLYWCALNIAPLEELLRELPGQYPSVAHDYHHILKSLVYFEDAENDPEPEITFSVDWKQVKVYFEKEVPLLLDKLI